MATDRLPLVFLGPTLAVDEAARVLSATYVPPAAQGSVVASVTRHDPSALLLIDGVFQGEPAVRHKEILWALSRGIPVYGAASMGALRAAELWPYGMIGIGLIFRWYRRFPLLPDDAVAVLHGPRELGWPALTEALVDLRATLRQAERAGAVDRALRRRLEAAAVALNFRERTLKNVVERAFGAGTRRDVLEALTPHVVSQKRADALAALRRVRAARLPREAPRTAAFVPTTVFLRDLRHARLDLP